MEPGELQTSYDLEQIEKVCSDLGLRYQREPNEICIVLTEARTLCFRNEIGGDRSAGVVGATSHFHGNLVLNAGSDRYTELDPPALLLSLRAGEVFLVDFYRFGRYQDSQFLWHLEPLDCQYIQPGEEVRVHYLPFPD